MATLAEKVKGLRTLRGFSQHLLADTGSCNQATITTMEAGRKCGNANVLSRLSKVFGVSLEYLLMNPCDDKNRINTSLWMPEMPAARHAVEKWLSGFSCVKALCEESELELKTYLKLKDGMAFLLGENVLAICKDDLVSYAQESFPGEGISAGENNFLAVKGIDKAALHLIFKTLKEKTESGYDPEAIVPYTAPAIKVIDVLEEQLEEYLSRGDKYSILIKSLARTMASIISTKRIEPHEIVKAFHDDFFVALGGNCSEKDLAPIVKLFQTEYYKNMGIKE